MHAPPLMKYFKDDPVVVISDDPARLGTVTDVHGDDMYTVAIYAVDPVNGQPLPNPPSTTAKKHGQDLRMNFKILGDARPRTDHPDKVGGYDILPWEKQTLNIIVREVWAWIMWVYDPVGRNGKNLLADYLVDCESAIKLSGPTLLKWEVVKKMITEHDGDYPDFDGVVVIELTLTDTILMDKAKTRIFLDILEKLQDWNCNGCCLKHAIVPSSLPRDWLHECSQNQAQDPRAFELTDSRQPYARQNQRISARLAEAPHV